MRPKKKWARKGTTGGDTSTKLRLLFEQAVLQGVEHVIGIDPDLRNQGICGWGVGRSTPRWVGTTRVPKSLSGQACAPHVFLRTLEILTLAHSDHVGSFVPPLVIVEGQRVRQGPGVETKNPQSLVDLAACAGACVGAVLSIWPNAVVIIAEPQTWAGSVKKEIRHRRTLDSLGWPYKDMAGYSAPTKHSGCAVLGKLNPGDWKHVMDGVGLAEWALKELKTTTRRLKFRRDRS